SPALPVEGKVEHRARGGTAANLTHANTLSLSPCGRGWIGRRPRRVRGDDIAPSRRNPSSALRAPSPSRGEGDGARSSHALAPHPGPPRQGEGGGSRFYRERHSCPIFPPHHAALGLNPRVTF